MSRRHKKPRSKFRNLAIIAALFLGVFVLVLLARGRNRQVVFIFPDERQARMEHRASSDNAMLPINAAIDALPAKPGRQEVVDDFLEEWWDTHASAESRGDRPPWMRETDYSKLDPPSLAGLCWLDSAVPEADIVAYANNCKAAADALHSALDKPFALLIDPPGMRRRSFEERFMQLGRCAASCGRVQFIATPSPEALRPLIDAIRYARMLSSEDNLLGVSQSIEGAALQQFRFLAERHDHLDMLHTALDALGPGYTPRGKTLHMLSLCLDDQVAGESYGPGFRPRFDFVRAFFRDDLQPVVFELKENQAELATLAEKPPHEFQEWIAQHAHGRGGGGAFGPPHELTLAMRRAAETAADYHATQIALALETCKLDTGNYPPDLNALTSKYLAALPSDPVTAAPFGYKPNDAHFLLYSRGNDLGDDNGDPAKDRLIAGPGL